MNASSRQVDGVTVLDVSGSITIDEGSAQLRETMKGLALPGGKILLNLGGVTELDGSGLGELVCAFTNMRQAGGELRLINPSREVHDLLQITKLCTVFEIEDDEASAVADLLG